MRLKKKDAIKVMKAKVKKFKCPKGKHKNWHYLTVWWNSRYGREIESHYTIVECYGDSMGYCRPFTAFDTEAELYYALAMMTSDVMRYPSVKVKEDPWESLSSRKGYR